MSMAALEALIAGVKVRCEVIERDRHGRQGRVFSPNGIEIGGSWSPGRLLTRSDQTGPGDIGWGEGRYGEGVYGGGPQLVVTSDEGSTRPLTAIMKNVIEMWEQLLARWKL